MLLRADRGSLFLVQGERTSGCPFSNNSTLTTTQRSQNNNADVVNNKPQEETETTEVPSTTRTATLRGRYLVSKLFDVCSKSTLREMEKKDEIRIPWGTGIVGFVAESGEPVNIPDAYQVIRKIIKNKKELIVLLYINSYNEQLVIDGMKQLATQADH